MSRLLKAEGAMVLPEPSATAEKEINKPPQRVLY